MKQGHLDSFPSRTLTPLRNITSLFSYSKRGLLCFEKNKILEPYLGEVSLLAARWRSEYQNGGSFVHTPAT